MKILDKTDYKSSPSVSIKAQPFHCNHLCLSLAIFLSFLIKGKTHPTEDFFEIGFTWSSFNSFTVYFPFNNIDDEQIVS